MRGGYPVRIVLVTACGATTGYWQAGSQLAGRCGHQHASREEAEPCLEPMTKQYIAKRWPKKAVKKLSKRKTTDRLHPCVHANHCPSCEAARGEMCKPYIRRQGKGRPRDGSVQRPHVTRLSKYERELPRG